MPVTKCLITCTDVAYQYADSGEEALSGITLHIHKGEFVGIIGPNGGGKTTLLKLLLGLMRPSRGNVSYSLDTSRLGYVPQHQPEASYRFPISVYELIRSGLTGPRRFIWGRDTRDKETAIVNAAEQTGVVEYLQKPITSLSGGLRQRAFIARSLVKNPEILFLDEPASGIDHKSEENLYYLLEKLHKNKITIVLVSHDIDVVSRSASEILCVNRTLMCHLPTERFDREEYLRHVYGDTMKLVNHSC